MTGAERAARHAVLREVADELTTLVLDDVLPHALRLRAETARRLGLTLPELACLDTLRRSGPVTSDLLGHRTGLGRSAVSKMVRRLEAAGHVERTPNPAHEQGVIVRLVPHEERDHQLERLRDRLRTALWGAAADAGLDRPRHLAGVSLVLQAITGCLYEAGSAAALQREARQARQGKRW